MKKIVAIQSDKLKDINIKTDTTILLALEAQKRGYSVIWYETKDLNLINSKTIVYGKIVKFYENKKNFYKVINKQKFNLAKVQYVLIRQNPPFNMDYINSTHFLDNINSKKIINNPTAIRNVSEKFFSSNFLKYMPKTIFTKNILEINSFLNKNKRIVVKPIHGYAGKNILFISSKLQKKKISTYVNKFGHVMVQKYLHKVKRGDKRVFIINGKVKGAIRRKPKKGSSLSNISQGGVAYSTKLNAKELKISKIVARSLVKNNIFFAGIDFVDGYLIGDINVTSPTGLPQYKILTGINLAEYFWDELEKLK
jgi:glutathione synthase|tara:strand:+ start:140 stop:1069 length:930 start_codon:yes stop_codon:yes gene_type:complete